MAYSWLKKRGKVFHICFAKSIGRKQFSLKTTDKALALEAQRRIESEIWCQERGIKRKVVDRLRYSDLVRRFIEHKNAAGISAGTISAYLRTLNHFGSFLQSDVYVDSITPEHVEGFITLRRSSLRHCDTGKAQGKLLKVKSIRNEVFTLVNLFTWATNRSLLLESPTKNIQKPPRVTYDAPRALRPEEYLALKENMSEVYQDILDLYLLSGIRRSDGLRITSENFDFEQMLATLPQHKQGTHKTIPIGKDLAEVVRRMIARVEPGRPLIQVQPSALTVNFRKARIKAGLPESITFHSLRHTFASWLAALGTDFKTLQELIGHRSGEATQIYVHAFNPNKRNAIDKLLLPRKAVNV